MVDVVSQIGPDPLSSLSFSSSGPGRAEQQQDEVLLIGFYQTTHLSGSRSKSRLPWKSSSLAAVAALAERFLLVDHLILIPDNQPTTQREYQQSNGDAAEEIIIHTHLPNKVGGKRVVVAAGWRVSG